MYQHNFTDEWPLNIVKMSTKYSEQILREVKNAMEQTVPIHTIRNDHVIPARYESVVVHFLCDQHIPSYFQKN
jgi:hypothetical protein